MIHQLSTEQIVLMLFVYLLGVLCGLVSGWNMSVTRKECHYCIGDEYKHYPHCPWCGKRKGVKL